MTIKELNETITALEGVVDDSEPAIGEDVTKKHFTMIASILKPYQNTEAGREIANLMANYFSDENPRFDKERFMKAAGASEV